MPKKQKTKKKVSPKLTQKEKFIAYAREVEADESGETFTRVMKKIAKSK